MGPMSLLDLVGWGPTCITDGTICPDRSGQKSSSLLPASQGLIVAVLGAQMMKDVSSGQSSSQVALCSSSSRQAMGSSGKTG